MIFSIPSYFALEAESQILMFMWSFGPLPTHTPSAGPGYGSSLKGSLPQPEGVQEELLAILRLLVIKALRGAGRGGVQGPR